MHCMRYTYFPTAMIAMSYLIARAVEKKVVALEIEDPNVFNCANLCGERRPSFAYLYISGLARNEQLSCTDWPL